MTTPVIGTISIDLMWVDPQGCADLPLPSYETSGSSGMDVAAAVETDTVVPPGKLVLVPTGLAVAIPPGYEIPVRPRSGLAVKHGITLINSPGTIDADYRGEIKIGLVNLGSEPYTVHRGARIAQLVVAPVLRADLRIVDRLSQTERGSGGFGHTGV